MHTATVLGTGVQACWQPQALYAERPFPELRPGQHITAVGADDQTQCELDAECLGRADRLIVDSVESSRIHGDIARHLAQGSIQPEQVHCELGSVLSGNLAGRRRDDEITIAKFVGLGVQDLAAAEVSLAKLALHP